MEEEGNESPSLYAAVLKIWELLPVYSPVSDDTAASELLGL